MGFFGYSNPVASAARSRHRRHGHPDVGPQPTTAVERLHPVAPRRSRWLYGQRLRLVHYHRLAAYSSRFRCWWLRLVLLRFKEKTNSGQDLIQFKKHQRPSNPSTKAVKLSLSVDNTVASLSINQIVSIPHPTFVRFRTGIVPSCVVEVHLADHAATPFGIF